MFEAISLPLPKSKNKNFNFIASFIMPKHNSYEATARSVTSHGKFPCEKYSVKKMHPLGIIPLLRQTPYKGIIFCPGHKEKGRDKISRPFSYPRHGHLDGFLFQRHTNSTLLLSQRSSHIPQSDDVFHNPSGGAAKIVKPYVDLPPFCIKNIRVHRYST